MKTFLSFHSEYLVVCVFVFLSLSHSLHFCLFCHLPSPCFLFYFVGCSSPCILLNLTPFLCHTWSLLIISTLLSLIPSSLPQYLVSWFSVVIDGIVAACLLQSAAMHLLPVVAAICSVSLNKTFSHHL